MHFTSSECRLFVEDAYVYRKREKKKKGFLSCHTSKSRDGHIANSSHVSRVTSLHSFPRWLILTTNRSQSALEILSLEAYQNVRNVLRLIAPQIHLSRRSLHSLFAFGFRWTVSSSSGSECEHNFVNFFLMIIRLRIFMPVKTNSNISWIFLTNCYCLSEKIGFIWKKLLYNIQLSYE